MGERLGFGLLHLTAVLCIQSVMSYITIKLTPTDLIRKINQSNYALDEIPTAYDRLFVNNSAFHINRTQAKHLGFSAFGIMLNMSYSQLFLRLSFESSLIYIQSLKHTFNTSDLKSNLYSPSDENCWLKSSKAEFCFSDSHFTLFKENIGGYLGHEFGFLGRHFLIYQSMVYIEKPIPLLNNEHIHGLLGLGFSDFEGAYGYMFIEQLLQSDVILKARLGICFNYFNSLLYLGNHEALNTFPNTTVFKLSNAFKLDLITSEIFVDNNKMSQEGLETRISIDEPFIYLPDSVIERIERQIIYYMCYKNRSDSVVAFKDKVCKEIPNMFQTGFVEITLEEKLLFEEFLPELTLTVVDEIKMSKIERKFKNYLRICPGPKNWTQLEASFNSSAGLFNVCSLLRRKNSKYDVVLGILFFEGTILGINYERGLMSLTPISTCPAEFVEVFEKGTPLGLDIVYNILCLMIISATVIFAVSKCDTYFHDDYEIIIEEEEGNAENEGEGHDPSRGD